MTLSQTIKWLPSTAPNILTYEIYSSDTGISGTYSLLVSIPHTIPGANWAGTYFYYVDTYIPYRYYRIKIRDQYGNVAEDTAPSPFLAGNDPVHVPVLQTIALNENTKSPNFLQYITTGGTPISGATIRVYNKTDYDLQNTALVVGITKTNAAGGWVDSIYVEPGKTYTLVYHKPNIYGPNVVEITV